MRRLVSLVFGSALLVGFWATPALADNGPHQSSKVANGATGVVVSQAGATKCAGCHRAHTAKGSMLLKEDGAALCTTCHAGAGAGTDVMDGVDVNAAAPTALRGGGFTTALIGTNLATKDVNSIGRGTNQSIPLAGLNTPTATTSKHNVDALGTIWGNGAIGSGAGKSVTLECTSCHDPHGNGNYRILRGIPNDAQTIDPTTKAVISGPTAEVNIPDAGAKVYTTADYWKTGDVNVPTQTVTYNNHGAIATATVDGYIANVSQWCTQCHTRYLATSGSYATPTNDPMFLYQHRSDANYKVGGANCITCHVAHGTNATMKGSAAQVALPNGSLGGSVASPNPSDSRLLRVDDRGTCVMCHNV